ncbi:hypothetical protein DL95DRAFT_446195 [Leptodontidium sp. 2 PMI_412]|nr:hypothetical protein DL95DRAFT_446195 [Leptodontidium sp. 2 PMI_412]
MSESGVSRRTESEVDNDENMMRGNRGGSASSPSAPSLKKGKGGRKVMFPSAEEKKQRNRDSQAAFRERRKEHISELENIVQEQKEKLQESKNAQASAKEEVLILKYKNSLLERILLEQGIDVNAELNNILVFPPRFPEKRVRKERVLARPDPEVVPSKRVTAMTSASPKTTSECCHCSSSRTQSSPASYSSTPPTIVESSSSTPQDIARKRARHNTADTRAHKHPRLTAQPVRKHQGHPRAPNLNHPGNTRYSSHIHGRRPILTFQTNGTRTNPCATTSTTTLILDEESDAAQSVWAPTPPLPFEVEHEREREHGAAKTQNPAKAAFDFDFDFEADFSFGGFAETSGGFDMDLGFLSSVHV